MSRNIPGWKDKVLLTPGPLTTSRTVKMAMLRDLGSRDSEFVNVVKEIRQRLLKAGEVDDSDYTTIILQGAGTYSIESVLSATVPQNGKVIVIMNGAYGRRIGELATCLKIPVVPIEFNEEDMPDVKKIEEVIAREKDATHVCMVHCETSTGMFNPIKEVGALVKKYNKKYFVDAMSSFGATKINLREFNIDYIVSSANKCIEGVPGFGFILCKKASLEQTKGYARSVSFDLYAQWKGLDLNGQFRFTPPTHSLNAFYQALLELEAEGGVEARTKRYRDNYTTLLNGMRELGFKDFLNPDYQGWIITAVRYPKDPKFNFETFFSKLNERGYVIYPGKAAKADCFRLGNIGRLFKEDMLGALTAVKEVIREMGFDPSK
ncbi:MAG: 2-aminoethylphosphonate--pyruvate transaminase [Bacteriovoracaceae bacterium]